jgi:hypothetical protein
MMDGFGQFFRAMAEMLCFWRQRDAEKNTPELQAAARARQEQARLDAAVKATAAQDVEKARQQLSEN